MCHLNFVVKLLLLQSPLLFNASNELLKVSAVFVCLTEKDNKFKNINNKRSNKLKTAFKHNCALDLVAMLAKRDKKATCPGCSLFHYGRFEIIIIMKHTGIIRASLTLS